MKEDHFEHFEFGYHLKKSKKLKLLGEGTHGIIELHECKDVHDKNVDCKDVHDKDVPQNTEIEICNKKFVIKKIKYKKNWLGEITNESMDRFYKEYNIGLMLNHNSIRKTLDIDLISKSILFENCDGLDLLDYANEYKNNDTRNLVVLFYQIIDAICYLHNIGICHLDVKLENILINPNTQKIKLIDFAEASIIQEDGDFLYGNKGTVQYMAPEVLNLNRFDSKRADLWSCGIVLYNLYYNTMPWEMAKTTDNRYLMHYKSIFADDKLNMFLFTDNTFFNEYDRKIIKILLKILLHPISKKRKTAEYIKNIFELITLENDNKYR
jgi:serine/threonine protein kinase